MSKEKDNNNDFDLSLDDFGFDFDIGDFGFDFSSIDKELEGIFDIDFSLLDKQETNPNNDDEQRANNGK